MNNIIVYDLEIIKAIPTKEPRIEGIEYCKGWQDHANMGVSVIGAYDFEADRYRVFTQDNWSEFVDLFHSGATMAGFNSIPFDNAVLKASGIVDIPEEQSCDLLREIWKTAGLGPVFQYPSHAGYSLDAVAKANGLQGKTGNGALAPVDWQRGEIGKVIDYCLMDVAITAKLIKLVIAQGELRSPVTGELIQVRSPLG
jgi:RNase_H superfamily